MQELLYQEIVSGFKVFHLLIAVVSLLVVSKLFTALFGSKDKQIASVVTKMKCGNCGWTGTASKLTLRCPKCGKQGMQTS